MKIFINVTQENLDGYRNRPSFTKKSTVNCPIHLAIKETFGDSTFLTGGRFLFDTNLNVVARFSDEVRDKSVVNCNGFGPFSFYIDIPKKFVKECSLDVY